VQLFGENGAPLLAETANLFSEFSVNQACLDHASGRHRFLIALPYGYSPNSQVIVRGLRIVDGVPNEAIAGSDLKLEKLTGLNVPYPALPLLAGAYRGLAEPGVFTSANELKDLASRVNRADSYSRRRFALLAAQIQRDLDSGIDWDVTYSGANGGVYQYAFSYEPQDHQEAETRAALRIPPDAKAPAGAAVVASRLALYAAIVKAGAALPAVTPSADEAIKLAKRILLAWADHGFREANGSFLALASFTRDGHNRPEAGLNLTLGRGVVYSVQAQDLLQSLGALNASEVRDLKFSRRTVRPHPSIGERLLCRGRLSLFAMLALHQHCDQWVVAMLATARVLNDERKFKAVLYGGDPMVPVLVPWTELFDHVLYGEADGPIAECVNNHEPDSLTSLAQHHDYQTTLAAPGEIADRFRNANAAQGIGYPMFTLERLINSAELLRNAGFDAYAYRGRHKQSLESALQYYACFAKGAGFGNVVTADNSRFCPNWAQYDGKIVNGVERMVLFGANRFKANASITTLKAAAQTPASNGPFATDAILFGKWQD